MVEPVTAEPAAEDLEAPVPLGLPPEQVCFIILKARAFDNQVDPVEPDPGSDPIDDGRQMVTADEPSDPTYGELLGAIAGLDDEQQIALVALAWLGRGDFERREWSEALQLATERHNDRTAEYLAGMPLLGDYLEEGFSLLGHSCAEFELGRL